MRIGCPNIHLRFEPTGIIQACSPNRRDFTIYRGLGHDRRTAVSAKAPMRRTTCMTGGLIETERPLRELESFGRHDDKRREWAAAGSLAISTVTVQPSKPVPMWIRSEWRRKRIRR
jgi:hypothetical protein